MAVGARRKRDRSGDPDQAPIGPRGEAPFRWGRRDGARPGTPVRWLALEASPVSAAPIANGLELQWSACSDYHCRRSTEPSPRKSWGWWGLSDSRGPTPRAMASPNGRGTVMGAGPGGVVAHTDQLRPAP